MKKISILDLKAQYRSIQKDIDNAINSVIKDTAFIGGVHVQELEEKIAKYCNTKYAVGLNSGTDALYLSLWALGVKSQDEVITSPFTFFATAEVIALLGAKPVFVDILPASFNIDPDLIEKKITKKTKAIIPVHLFGQPARMDKIIKLAKKHNLHVIEDAAQAIGSEFKNKKTGNLADIGCFSFYPTKNLGAYGDGGMITTNSKRLADTIKMLRNHGSVVKYDNKTIGISSRLDGIQASILVAKLKYLDKWNKQRKTIAKLYNEKLANISFIETPSEEKDSKHIYHQYTIRVKNNKRDNLRKYLLENGISTMIYYPKPLHLLEAFKYLGYKMGDFPQAEQASLEVLSLPMYPELEKDKINYITKLIKKYV